MTGLGCALGGEAFELGQDVIDLSHIADRDGQNAHATPGAELNKPLGFKNKCGFADGGAGHAQTLGDLGFQMIGARRQIPGKDHLPKRLKRALRVGGRFCIFRGNRIVHAEGTSIFCPVSAER